MKTRGFTIVELLIVIVVIAILAAISVVAYTGIQDRAKFAATSTAMSQIQKALETYRAQEGSYPYTGELPAGGGWRYSCRYSNPTSFIPGITAVVGSLSAAPCSVEDQSSDTWLYGSNGTSYKLLYLRANVSDGYRNNVPLEQRDTRWSSTSTSWGYWSPGAATW